MAFSAATPLFYATKLTKVDLARLVTGSVETPAIDVIDFPAEEGGEVRRELAVPLLPGMDEIEVEQAQIRVRGGQKELEIDNYTVTAAPGNLGVIVSLTATARLKKVELSYSSPPPAPSVTYRLVIRTPPDGPPIFAHPSFPAPGKMYDRVLAGLEVSDLGENRKLLSLPNVLGSGWLIQLATGNSPTELTPTPFSPSVNRVVINAAPRDLTVTLSTDSEDIPLWGHPDALLPDAGTQEINFTPLAQKHLAKRLQTVNGAADQVTLPTPLRFQAKSGGALDIVSKTLTANYVVKPLGKNPLTLRVGGEWTPLALSAPAGLRPADSTARLTAKFLGRVLNRGSAEPPLSAPHAGLRVTASRTIACLTPFLPEPPAEAGSVLPLVSVRAYVAALADTETVLEVRNDAAGAPGAMLAASVQQLQSGWKGWREFIFSAPLPVSTGQAPLWLSLRVTKGEVLWFTTPSTTAESLADSAMTSTRVSMDRGRTWGDPTGVLGPTGIPFAQCFHELPELPAAPTLRMRYGEAVLTDNFLLNPEKKGVKEYIVKTKLPTTAHDLLAKTTGAGRVMTTLHVFSSSMLDVVVEDFTLLYDPFQIGRVGG